MQELRTDRCKLKELFPTKAKKYAQKLHKKANEIEFIRKGIPIDPDNIEIKEGERAAIRLITTPHLDRDGEILIPGGAMLDDFRQSPSVLFGHDYKSLPVGSDQWIKLVKEGILAKTVYAKHQFAEDVYQCVKDKHLNSNSVGFIPVEVVNPEDNKKEFAEWQGVLEKDYGIDKEESGKAKAIYPKWIMLEHSDVPVASNAQSLNLAVGKGELVIQSERLKKDLEIEVVKDKKIEVVKDFATGKLEIIKERDDDKKEEESKGEETTEAGAEEEKVETVNKPEVTENYVRIPVNTTCKITATITISAKEGIKALYCGKEKKVRTYLFDRRPPYNWTMEKAKKWIQEHKEFTNIKTKEPEYKERWNKSLSKVFDVEAVQAPIATFSYALYEKFLECKVKEIFLNSYSIPSPLLGTYLAGFKNVLGDFKLKDTRNFTYDGRETPPIHEVIKLNSEKSDDFLIDGVRFYDANDKPLVIKFSLGWSGINVSIVTSNENKEWNKELLDKVHDWAYKNNYLRGEKFALSGEFLDESGDNWDNLILDAKYKDSIVKSANFLEKKGKALTGRGLLFIGPPGTGKTKTGRVLINELDTTFIWVSSRDFKYGTAIGALSLGFSLARDLAPSILFLEDIDTWLGGNMTDLIKTEMDGIKQNKGIITVLTSNYPEKLPDALLDRPGRFHHIINFELPKGKQRKEMIVLWAGDIEEKLLDDIVEKTEGFSGAHLKELVEFAKMIAEEDEAEIGDALLKSLDKLIEQRELIEEIRENKVDTKAFWGKVGWSAGNIKIGRTWDELGDEEKKYISKTGKRPPYEIKAGEKQEEFKCECISCGWEHTSDKHCDTYKCDKCGGEMRRISRPGPGKDIDFGGGHTEEEIMNGTLGLTDKQKDEWAKSMPIISSGVNASLESAIKGLTEQVTELKEGRVLSTKNRTLVKDIRDLIRELDGKLTSLLDATEPTSREEEKEAEKVVVLEKSKPEADLVKRVADVLEQLKFDGKLEEMLKGAADLAIKKKLGKVE